MNKTLVKRSIRATGAALLAIFAVAAIAQTTTVDVDALANCANLNGGLAIAPVYTGFDAGTYTIKITSSNATYCTGRSCAHPNVALTIDDGVNYHTDTVIVGRTKATTLSFGGPAHVWAYFLDTQCEDNRGGSVLQFTQN